MIKKDNSTLLITAGSIAILFFGFLFGNILYYLFAKKPIPVISSVNNIFRPLNKDENKEVVLDIPFREGNGWKFFSDAIYFNRDTNTGIIYNVTACYYQNNVEKIVLESEKAEIDNNNELLNFTSKVRAFSSKGECLEVDRLKWDHKNNSVYGEGNVKLLKNKTLIKGDAIKADPVLQTYNLSGNVQVIKIKIRRNDIENGGTIKRKVF